MQSIHPIGSFIKIAGKSVYVVVGYRLGERDGTAILAYLLVPYPLGFLDDRSLYTTPVDIEHEVLDEGLIDDSAKGLLKRLSELADMAKGTSFKDLQIAMEAFAQYMGDSSEKGGQDE